MDEIIDIDKEEREDESVKYKDLIKCNELESNLKSGKEFEKINQNILHLLNKDFEIPLKLEESNIRAKNFVLTKNAIKKLKEIKYYIMHNYPILLEGPTGTAKTKSVEIICEEMGVKLKRFNLSSETKTADLFGRYGGDPDSFSGISFQEGVFIEAFKNGYTLLLDEINLASNQVLQSFEECLDSHKISCEIPGMPWKEIEMGEGFNLIATQNPNKGLFANKRQELGKKFLSRFHIINFDSFQKDELYEIAQGLGAEKHIEPIILKELVDFHDEWSNLEERKNDILCFTIREIEATINAINNGKNTKEAILSIYGSRYKSKEYEKLKVILNKYRNLVADKSRSYFKFENEFLYMTPLLENFLKTIKLSFENYRHVMIIGDEGTGKTQIAKYFAEYYDKLNDNFDYEYDNGIYYCECTEELKCSDLIGNQYPSFNNIDGNLNSQQLMKWEDGFLTLAINKGKCCILDNIEEAPATITERLNGLLDKKLNLEKDPIFEIPECPEKKYVKINKNFRLLCICNYNSISKMSPAFLNRFDIVTLEDQMKPISNQPNSEKIFLALIDTLIRQHSFNYLSNSKKNEEESKKNEKKIKYNKYIDMSDEDEKISNINNKQNKFEFKYKKDENLIRLIYERISNNLKNGDLSIYKLSLFCRSVYIFTQELDPKKEIKLDKLINYAYQLIISPEIEDDESIEKFIYKNYLNCQIDISSDNKYFFQESPKLKSFMAKLFAASLINLYICVIGKTGVGKTSCAREFSRIRAKIKKLSKEFYMHSFHSNTKPNHIYGNITMKNGQIDFINGSLLNAMEKGTTFIADEMNLSPEIVMKSLVPALDLNLNCKMFIPGVKKKIQIHQKFFFICCQNDFTTTGRNSLPKLLLKKLKCIPYPEPPTEDIQNICSSINLELYEQYDEMKKNELIQNGKNIAKFMEELNKLKLSYIPNWSIRDVTKVLKRIQFQSLPKNNHKFNNINFVDNIIFYTLSSIYKKDIKYEAARENLLDKLLKILNLIFNLDDNEINNIKEIFKEGAKIDGNYLRKGKCGISLESIPSFNKNKKIFSLPSLYNELFQIMLAHDEEPILIIGESGYKTYLANLVLPNVKPIQLNSETNIGQLLGSTIFLSDTEAKGFYLKQIYNILDIAISDNEIKMVQKWVNYDESNYKKIMEEQEKLKKNIEKYKHKSKVQKFQSSIDILLGKLMNDGSNKKKNLNNINLEFKPGLILNSILSGKSLILKYLSNLPTVVLERFNELFSGKHNLTLNEDIHDTFTKEGSKEFSNLGENCRIFATCSLGEQNKLSEAVLSRFTIICSDKYKPEEQKEVLISFLSDKKLEFKQNCIDEVIRFSKLINNNSLSLMLNALSLSNEKEIFKEDENCSRINILSFILYRIRYGLSYKIKTNPGMKNYDIEDKLKSYLPHFNGEFISGEDTNEEPLITKKINKITFIESKYSKLQIEYGNFQEIKNEKTNNLCFTKTFTEMVDYIHMGIATNTPIILEGGTGLGKQTAINYVANKLNYKIINFIITQSTKIEDLLGRNQIIRKDGEIKIEFCETKILKALVGTDIKEEDTNVIIVFHNLNKSSSALMESLCSIFNKNQTHILRPDGISESKRKKLNLIGIINSQSNIAIKDKLPISLINCVFYYILPKLSPKEIAEIIKKKFTDNHLVDDIQEFVECFNKSREFSYIKGNISYFSLNDITKYILFRRETKDSLDKSIILQIVFAYRFIQNEFIKDIMDELGFLSLKLNPIFRYKDDYLSVKFKNKDSKKEIELLLQYKDKFNINKDKIFQKINTLNIKQKQCLLFLVLSILCKRACIIQGDTASGKTHLVRLFAEMVGQKLIVYQINKETGLSIFTGQSTLLNKLEEDEISIISKHFNRLCENQHFKSYIDNYFFFDNANTDIIEKKWSIKQFKKLINEIRNYIKNNNEKMEDEEYKDFKAIANELEDLIQPYNRFKKSESKFMEALREGYWVLIDGIESANPVISDKLIRLCDENPELDLTETGENIIFSNKSTENTIHQNFHLFINYNPLNKSNNNQLNEMFLNKCITFTLVPMDVDIDSSAQIIYGYMKNSDKLNEIICQEISSKIAFIHQEMNIKINQNQEFFSGGVQFTGRIIKYISEEIYKSKSEKDLCINLVNAFYLNYINSVNNKNNKDNIIEVKNIIHDNLKKNFTFDTGEKNIFLKYSEIFKVLRSIQKVIKKNIDIYDLNIFELLRLLKSVEIGDLKIINYHINGTLKMLDEFFKDSLKSKMKYCNFYNLVIVKKLIENILDYIEKNPKHNLMDFTLNDEEELINKSILTKEISKFNLVYELEKKFKISDNYIYLSDEIIEYINSIKKLLETNDIKDFYQNLKIVKKLLNNGIIVIRLFPFNQILLEKKRTDSKIVRMFKMILLTYKLIENKINFQFGYDSNILSFNFKNNDGGNFQNLLMIINLDKDFYMTDSKITIKSELKEKKIVGTSDKYDNEEEKITVNNWFYDISFQIIDNKLQLNDKQKIFSIIENFTDNKIRTLDEINKEFKRDIISENRAYRLLKLSYKYGENSDITEDNLIKIIWHLILFYDKEKLELISPHFCLPFEKELLIGIKKLYEYEYLDIKFITKILNFTKNFLELKSNNSNLLYGNSHTFLYKIQAGFFDYLDIDDKDKRDYLIQIENEMKLYNKFNSPLNKFWSIDESYQSLNNQYINLKDFDEKGEQLEIYKNKLNELISTINDIDENEKNKNNLIRLLRNKLNKPTKEVYEACKENIDNYIKNLNQNLAENQISFPSIKSSNFNDNDNYVICLDILKTYSSQHRKLNNIFNKSKNIISDILNLEKEIEIINDILFKYALEKGEFMNMYKNQVMGIIRALILYKIIKLGRSKIKSLFSTFLKLTEIINDQTGGRGIKYFNEDILKWATKSIKDNLEDYLLIPKFEPKDFLYLFLITYTEEKENNEASVKHIKGFLFKNWGNDELDSVLYKSLDHLNQQEMNDGFQNCIEKIGRSLFQSILPEKCGDNFNELTYREFQEKLEDERKVLKSKILESGQNKQSHSNLEMKEEIIKQILNCFILATTYEQNISHVKLTYDDIDFFKSRNWSNEIMSKYPGMLFWLSKYYNYNSFYTNLISKIDNNDCFITKENQISFWYFKIRLSSNIQTFEYDCYKQKNIEIDNKKYNVGNEFYDDGDNSLKNTIEKFIKESIVSLIKKNEPININWIYLVLNEIPSELKLGNKNVRHFYEFFAILLADSKGPQKVLKNEIIIEYIKKLFDLIFQNKIDELFEKDINCNDELIKFIDKPQAEIIKKIKEKNQKELLETKILENVKKTDKLVKVFKKSGQSMIDTLNSIVKEKTTEYHNIYLKERENKLKYEVKNIEEEIEKTKKKIEDCLNVIENKDLQDQKKLKEKIDNFDNLMKSKNYFNFTSEKKTIYYELKVSTRLKDGIKYNMKIRNKITDKNEKIEFDNSIKDIYLQASIFEKKDILKFSVFLKDDPSIKFNIRDKVQLNEYDIYNFKKPLSFNEGIKEKMIKDVKNEIDINESIIKFNGETFNKKKFDNFMKLIAKFNISLLEKTDKYDQNLKSEINKLKYEAENIIKYLNLKTTNGDNDENLENKVKELKNLLVILRDYLGENYNDVKTIIALNQKNDRDSIFIVEHNKKIALYEEPKKKLPISISNIDFLKYPMISDNGKNLTFSSKLFKMFLGSYIPSTLSSPLIIKLLNLKENKIKGNIIGGNKNIVKVDENNNENTLNIFINIQNFKSDEYYKENIKFKLEISSEIYSEIKIPFDLSINIIPHSILFSCFDYGLNYDPENNIFDFISPILYADSEISFLFKYLYISKSHNKNQLNDNTVEFKCSLDSLDNNNSIKPSLQTEKNKLILGIPKNKDGQNNILNFILKIYFSSTFYINIRFNSKIYKYDFNFQWYSYNKKKFTNEKKIYIYIDKASIPYEYTLYFKVEKIFPAKTSNKFEWKLPTGMVINYNNFDENENKKEFIFNVKLKINSFSSGTEYYFKVKSNQVSRELHVFPRLIKKTETNLLEDLYDLPKYKYSPNDKNFVEENDIERDSIYITPFNSYIPFVPHIYQLNKETPIPNCQRGNDFSIYYYYDKVKAFKIIKLELDYFYSKYCPEKFAGIGIFNEDKWYPLMKMETQFGDIFEQFENLKYIKDNIEKSKEILSRLNEGNDYWYIPRKIKFHCENSDINFFQKFIKDLPITIKKELNREYEIIKSESDVSDWLPIIGNNLIFILYRLFKSKYEEIKNNNNILYLTDFKIPKNIRNKIKEKQKDYFTINEREFSELNNQSCNFEIENVTKGEGYNNYLLQENKNPEKIDAIKQIPLNEEEIKMEENKSEKFDINDISLGELKYPIKNSINEIIKYYNNCYKITNILYFYIIAASKSNNSQNQNNAGNYYQKLTSISEQFGGKKNYSFFSTDINEFLSGLINLDEKLEKIGYKKGKPKIFDRIGNIDAQNYILFPTKNDIIRSKDNWKTEKNLMNNKFKQEEAQTGNKLRTNRLKNDEYFLDNNDSDSEEENKNYNIVNNEIKENNEYIDIEKIKIMDIGDNRFDDNNFENNNLSFLEDDNFKNSGEKKVKVGKITDNLVVTEPTIINDQNFKEDDGIKRALILLEEEKKKKDSNIAQKLDLGNPKKYHKFYNMEIFNIDNYEKLNIQQLYIKASFLANQLFIKVNGNGKIKYSDTLVLLLIDPSVYISEEIKLLNMFIICAMTNALNCLEIKYSIVLMGDEEFRCVLKDYKEPHSIEALERVYECLMLRRFRTNIPGCLKYAIEEISNKADFKYNSFFIFTDGLDKRFIYTQKNTWDTNIFNRKSNSFGFIFVLSSILTSKNKDFLNEIWKTFLNESKNNSRSGIFLKSLELKIDEDFKKKINEIFVLNLLRTKIEEKNEIKYTKPIFTINNENSISTYLKNNEAILDDKSLFKLNGSYIKNDVNLSSLNTNKEQLDINYYKNNLHQIAKKRNNNFDEQEINTINFAHKFLSIRTNLNRGILEEVFKPNKANVKLLSNTGTEIDIMALILYFLNPVPDPMIYLQDAIGNVKEYAITIIIDTSFSVLNHLNINHSLNTIRVLLSSFTIIDLPSFDLIITGEEGPIVLCSEYPTFAALNEKSKLWELLFYSLSNPISNADLLSALQTAYDLKRMRTNNFPSFLFVLTDGLFEEEKQNQLKENIAKLVQNNIHVIGIGLGIFPFGINNIFGQAIFDINPMNIFHSILSILEGNISDNNEMDFIQKEEENEKNILNAISKLIQNKNYFYKELIEELKQSRLTTNCYDMLTDEEIGGFDEQGRQINPKGDNIGLLKPDSLDGQTILIVMLWSCKLSPKENKLLDPENIDKRNELNTKSIKDTVDYLKVKIKKVLNYKDAIKEITDKDKNGKCNYYTVWVMCGPSTNKLPDGSIDPGLVEQFIDCLILYWQNGGSIVFFCDNEPFYFQANMFLEKVRFQGEISKTNLRIEGNDPGQNVLRGVNANGNLNMNSIYDTGTIRLPNGTERMPLGRNVPQIYEGETISHSNSNNKDDIKPFIPFAKNSSGNYCIMIDPTQGKEGDIIIDCGYTKVFINMSTEDIATWRYIQNLAGFLARPEVHLIYDDGETAKNYRPNGINFKISYNKDKLYKYSYGTGELDIIYMIDSTGSMEDWINGVKNKCNEILDKLNENPKIKQYSIKFGGVFYRDPVDCPPNKKKKSELFMFESSEKSHNGDKHEHQPLGSVDNLRVKMNSIEAYGGGDTPEDWVGAYEIALDNDKMKWRENSIKIIIHIADAGAHTLRFSDGDTKHNEKKYEIGLVELIQKCAQKNISIFGYQIDDTPKKSFLECQKIYNSVKSETGQYEIYEFKNASEQEIAEKLKDNITAHISAFLAKN